MGADKSYVNKSHHEFDDNNQTVLVTSNIENIVLISYSINCSKICFHICEGAPL